MCAFVSASVNKQVVDLSDELARKVEDSLRQQEEISSLLAQIVDLQARCKGVSGSLRLHAVKERNFLISCCDVSLQLTHENEELNQTLSGSRESQTKLKAEARNHLLKFKLCQ